MNRKKWLILVFTFTATINVWLAIDLYAYIPRVIASAVAVTAIVFFLLTRFDRILLRRLRRWYQVKLYGSIKQ